MTEKSDKPFTILVVDDEPDLETLVTQRLRRLIRKGEYSFVFARNGLEALEMLRKEKDGEERIDMVLSDINMPQMDGLTLLSQLPEVDPNLRAVIVSAYGDMRNIRTAMNRGAFDFVTKPIDFEDLRLTIQRTKNHLAEWRTALASRDQLVSIKRELKIAGETQQSILPTSFPQNENYDIHANMVPAREVGGDMYDVLEISDGKVFAVVADVTGKGVPAALMMMAVRMAFKGCITSSGDLGAALAATNELLTEDSPEEMFITMIALIYDPESGDCSYASAGHHAPLLVKTDGSTQEVRLSAGIALGVFPGFTYENQKITLKPGESLLLYSDGVTEAMTNEREEFGIERLSNVFGNLESANAKSYTDRVFDAVRDFVGDAVQSDDITCLCVHRSEAASSANSTFTASKSKV